MFYTTYRAISDGVEVDWFAVVGWTIPDNFKSVRISRSDDWKFAIGTLFLRELIQKLRRLWDGTSRS